MKANRKNLGDENAILDVRIPAEHLRGAGVHVEYLSRELGLMEVDVRAFGNQLLDTPNLKVRGFPAVNNRNS